MTKKEEQIMRRVAREAASEAWSIAINNAERLSIPLELAALDEMIDQLREYRAHRARILERLLEADRQKGGR